MSGHIGCPQRRVTREKSRGRRFWCFECNKHIKERMMGDRHETKNKDIVKRRTNGDATNVREQCIAVESRGRVPKERRKERKAGQ